MDTEFPFVNVGELGFSGPRDEGTRVYRLDGTVYDLREWIADVMKELNGRVIPLQWVAEYVGVTRGAVRKRVKKGKLTVFTFELKDWYVRVLGWERKPSLRARYEYVPLLECDAWMDEIGTRVDPKMC